MLPICQVYQQGHRHIGRKEIVLGAQDVGAAAADVLQQGIVVGRAAHGIGGWREFGVVEVAHEGAERRNGRSILGALLHGEAYLRLEDGVGVGVRANQRAACDTSGGLHTAKHIHVAGRSNQRTACIAHMDAADHVGRTRHSC